MSQQLWVTYGHTESHDDLPVVIWHHKPTDEEIDEYYASILPEEYEEVGFVNWTLDTPEVVI